MTKLLGKGYAFRTPKKKKTAFVGIWWTYCANIV